MKRTGNPNTGTAPCFWCLGLQSFFPLSESSGQSAKQRPREWLGADRMLRQGFVCCKPTLTLQQPPLLLCHHQFGTHHVPRQNQFILESSMCTIHFLQASLHLATHFQVEGCLVSIKESQWSLIPAAEYPLWAKMGFACCHSHTPVGNQLVLRETLSGTVCAKPTVECLCSV